MIPLVTAVMITGKHPERQPFAHAAINSFLEQTWVNRELLIIHELSHPLAPGAEVQLSDLAVNLRENCPFAGRPLEDGFGLRELAVGISETVVIRELYVKHGERKLGGLRNYALDNARGDYMIQWDDDDYSHPNRIATQVEFCKGRDAVVLERQVRYSFASNTAYTQQDPVKGIPGTILHRKTSLRYNDEPLHEDSHFWDALTSKAIYPNRTDPHLYLRFAHNHNSWNERHIMRQMYGKQNHWRRASAHDGLPLASANYLREVLHRHYKFACRQEHMGEFVSEKPEEN